MNKILIFKIRQFYGKSLCYSEPYSFDGPAEFKGLNLTSNISGKVTIMRMEEGLSVNVENIELELEFECQKCLSKFQKKIKIQSCDRQFYFEPPEIVEDPNDIYLIDEKQHAIDLSELLRQEIILHFPPTSVCSKGCKGICPSCGKNRNKTNCNCKSEQKEEKNYPLAQLKDLLK